MFAVGQNSCRTIAPLIARYNDPDLTEAEYVALSTHLLRCPQCLAQVQSYRALDQQLRTMHQVVIDPRVRSTVFAQVAVVPHGGITAIAVPWRQAWVSMAVIFSLATVLFAAGLTTVLAAQQTDSRFSGSQMLMPPVADSVQVSPTRVIASGGNFVALRQPVVQAQATKPAAIPAQIRSVDPTSGHMVVLVGGAQNEERLIVLRDTAIVHNDGSPGTMAELIAGLQVRVLREANQSGLLVACEIIIK